jgi:hypothetical protein
MKKTVTLSFTLFFLCAAVTAQTVFSIRSSDGVVQLRITEHR